MSNIPKQSLMDIEDDGEPWILPADKIDNEMLQEELDKYKR